MKFLFKVPLGNDEFLTLNTGKT